MEILLFLSKLIFIMLIFMNSIIKSNAFHSTLHTTNKLKFKKAFNYLSMSTKQSNEIEAHSSCSSTDSTPKNPPKLLNFYNMPENEFTELLASWNQPKYRSEQVRKWIYERGVLDFNDMKDIPTDLRNKLAEFFSIGSLQLVSEQKSKDGTRKRAYELHDGQLIESVLMPYDDGRYTACISSQAGCAMGCVFCATGQMGFARQLSSAEIFEQAQRFSAELKLKDKRLSNIVFMGMGEPLANYDNVMEAVRRFNTELGIGMRHLTISTVGLAPRIRKLADSDLQVSLAISLHQATNEKRSPLMPINGRFPIEELLDSCRYYISKTNRRISFEWALIRGETDTPGSARELGRLLKGMLCHVNVIPLNPTKGYDGRPTSKVRYR
jgi:23S rRNA (adenine2503-C2)-methyltransferase